jgi:hypothetical protein
VIATGSADAHRESALKLLEYATACLEMAPDILITREQRRDMAALATERAHVHATLAVSAAIEEAAPPSRRR